MAHLLQLGNISQEMWTPPPRAAAAALRCILRETKKRVEERRQLVATVLEIAAQMMHPEAPPTTIPASDTPDVSWARLRRLVDNRVEWNGIANPTVREAAALCHLLIAQFDQSLQGLSAVMKDLILVGEM
jgi:hypothetical protein